MAAYSAVAAAGLAWLYQTSGSSRAAVWSLACAGLFAVLLSHILAMRGGDNGQHGSPAERLRDARRRHAGRWPFFCAIGLLVWAAILLALRLPG